MNIRAIKDSSSLIKGHLYEVASIWNTNGNGRVTLVDTGGTHFVSYFTDTSGKALPSINAHYQDTHISTKFEDLSVGDLVVCNSKGHKTLTYGKMYRVEDLISKKNKFYTESKIKLEGVSRVYSYNSWNWRKLTKDEQRDIHLLEVLDNKTPDIVKSVITDKFSAMPNPEIELFTAISESVVDRKRHHFGLIEWYCRTVPGKRMNAKPEDFERIMDMPLRDIIKLIDDNTK
jgi:hypothetical protein